MTAPFRSLVLIVITPYRPGLLNDIRDRRTFAITHFSCKDLVSGVDGSKISMDTTRSPCRDSRLHTAGTPTHSADILFDKSHRHAVLRRYEDPFFPLVIFAETSSSSASIEIAMMPLARRLKIRSAVFLTVPPRVTIMMYSFSLNSLTGRIASIFSPGSR